jgi:rhamnosyltransferase
MKKRVLVLLATFNGQDFLKQQIDTILNQSNVEVTILAQDDSSGDYTPSILEKYSLQNANFLIKKSNSKFGSGALNFLDLLVYSDFESYDYIAFSDQDDIWAPDKLQSAIYLMGESGSLGYSSDLVAYSQEKYRAWWIQKSQSAKSFDYLFQGASAGCTYVLDSSAVKLVSNALRNKILALTNKVSHDWLIYAICRSNNLKWCMDNRSFIFYRQHKLNSYGSRQGFLSLLSKINLVRSNWYFSQICLLENFINSSAESNKIFERLNRLSISDRFSLALQAGSFRRKLLDCFFLAFSILFFFK